jgi:DNA-binding transcriptional ArsR family regulator
MDEEKITLDRKVFRTLASGTRIEMLKSLDRRRKTLTELSKQFGMSVSTIKEHLDNLVSVGLIEQKDEGHKWKYYELTRKGKRILHPEETKIWILLGISVLGMVGIGYDLIQRFYSVSFLGVGRVERIAPMAEAVEKGVIQTVPIVPYLHIIGFIIFGVILGGCLGYLISRRRMSPPLEIKL